MNKFINLKLNLHLMQYTYNNKAAIYYTSSIEITHWSTSATHYTSLNGDYSSY